MVDHKFDVGIGRDDDTYCNCQVPEAKFPSLGKCCSKVDSISGSVYQGICPYISIWNSLPEGTSLAITHIFGCSHYGYGRRVKE